MVERTHPYSEIWDALNTVMDPEIPNVSLVEMVIIDEVRVEGVTVHVVMIPTFSGCPALDVMRDDVENTIMSLGFHAEVSIARKPWSTDRISESARNKMKTIGLAPPKQHGGNVEWELFSPVPCPWCTSENTTIENQFGPTLCRAMYYCNECQQPFEQFKPL